MSVYRPKGSRHYLFDFKRGGRRFHGTTRRTSRRDAESFEREKIAEAEAALKKPPIDKTTISAVWGRWWIEKGQHDKKSSTTFSRMERLQDGLTAVLEEQGEPAVVGAITDDVVASYVANRRAMKTPRGRYPTPATVNRETQLLRRILRRARNTWKMEIQLPSWGDLLLPEPDSRVVTMGPELEGRLLENMREEYRPACRFLVMAGPRCGNVFPLHPDAVDFEQDIITLMLKSKKPGGRLLILPITRKMKILLANEIGNHPESVFTYIAKATRNGRVRGKRYPITYWAFYQEFKRAARAIGRPGLRPHDLRHVAGTRILKKTGNLMLAKDQLGHTRVSTTQKYAHVLVDALRDGMEATHGPEESPEESETAIPKFLKTKREA